MKDYYTGAIQILDDCDASNHEGKNEVTDHKRTWHVCTSCWNKHVEARRAARKMELADAKAARKTQERENLATAATRWAIDGGRMVRIDSHPGGFAIFLGKGPGGGDAYVGSGSWLGAGVSTWHTYDAAKSYAEQRGGIVVNS